MADNDNKIQRCKSEANGELMEIQVGWYGSIVCNAPLVVGSIRWPTREDELRLIQRHRQQTPARRKKRRRAQCGQQ